MPVYKDKSRGTWYVVTRYKDWTGKLRTTTKRGFKSKVEAKRYEVEVTFTWVAGEANPTTKLWEKNVSRS